jgi:hypothetical protein
MNRTPPTSVARTLRQEVGFGCPIPKAGRPCGNPYLSYHHFDPPWSLEEHHNPAGMIALCAEHHAKADVAGAFPIEYLRKLKKEAGNSGIEGRFDWLLRDFVVVMGGAYAANTVVPITYGDKPVIGFARDPFGFLVMNLDMPTASIAPRLRMWESSWYERGDPRDLECPPSGRLVKVHYKNGDYLRVEFSSVANLDALTRRFPQVHDIGPVGATYPSTVIEIELRLTEADLLINKDTFRVGGLELKNTLQMGGQRFVAIGTHEPLTSLTDFFGFSAKQIGPRLRLASQNCNELLWVDDAHFIKQVISMDGYAYIRCTFTQCRLMFSGRPFGIDECTFDGSTLVLTDEAISTCKALGLLHAHLNLDVAELLQRLMAL